MESIKSQMDIENVKVARHGSKSVLIAEGEKENIKLRTFKATMNTMTHILIGFTVGVNLFFAFSFGRPLSATPMHIVLCVIEYQFLMAEGILIMLPENSWSATLTLVQKRRLHWILQIMGSALAIAGSIVLILVNPYHWDTLHGQFGLVAMIFTIPSLINGLTSLYAYELRGILSGKLSKITHIVFGSVAFATSSISLCYGYDKESFQTWGSPQLSITLVIITSIFTFIVFVNPIITMFGKYFSRNRNTQ